MKRTKQIKTINKYKTLTKKHLKLIKSWYYNWAKEEMGTSNYKVVLEEVAPYDLEDWNDELIAWNFWVYLEDESGDYVRVTYLKIPYNSRKTLKQLMGLSYWWVEC